MSCTFNDATDGVVIVISLGLQPMRCAGLLDYRSYELHHWRCRRLHCHRTLALTAADARRASLLIFTFMSGALGNEADNIVVLHALILQLMICASLRDHHSHELYRQRCHR